MIRFLSPEDDQVLRGLLLSQGIYGVKALSQYETYGPFTGIVDFWLLGKKNEPTGVLFRQGSLFGVCGQGDPEELSDFLGAMAPQEVEGPPELLDDLRIEGVRRDGWLFSVSPFLKDWKPRREMVRPQSLSHVYQLLCQGEPGFGERIPYEGWLTENSHKVRHGLADIWVAYHQGVPVCTNGVYYKSQEIGLVASGTTAPSWRGKGYFQDILGWTAYQSLKQGQAPWLVAATPQLRELYIRLKLEEKGGWGRLLLEKP